ncbi:hypothetical protein AAE478_004852 [Parahypoxylon ruwenzoriense]
MSQLLQRNISLTFTTRTYQTYHGLCRTPTALRPRLVDRIYTPTTHICHRLGRRHNHTDQDDRRSKFISRMIIFPFIGANCLVFWWWTEAKHYAGTQTRDPKRFKKIQKMYQHYTLSPLNIYQGRWYTLLSSVISHETLPHLVFNMISFHAFTSCALMIGLPVPTVLALGLGSGVAGGLACLIDWRRKGLTRVNGLGASGVISGMSAALACTVPFAPFQLMFIPVGIPLFVLTLGYIAYDSYWLNSEHSNIGHAAHLGGAAFGVCYYALVMRKYGGASHLWRHYTARFSRFRRPDVPISPSKRTPPPGPPPGPPSPPNQRPPVKLPPTKTPEGGTRNQNGR